MKFKNNKGLINFNNATKVMFLFFCYNLFIACENKLDEIKQITELVNVNFESATDVEIKYTEHGKLKAILVAEELLKNNDTKNTYAEFKKGIVLNMFDKTQKQTGYLQANYAIKYDKAKETLVSGNVIVKNENGNKLETEELKRNDKNGELTTNKFVKITTDKEIIWGTGLKANEDFSWYKIDSMEGTIQINKSEFK